MRTAWMGEERKKGKTDILLMTVNNLSLPGDSFYISLKTELAEVEGPPKHRHFYC